MTKRSSDAPTVVVTGASSGIGAEAARQLAARGYQLALVGRSPDRTEAIARELGGRAYVVDYESSASVRALAASLHADLRPRLPSDKSLRCGYGDPGGGA